MAAGTFYTRVDLNGSGAGSAIINLHGMIAEVKVARNSGTPSVTVATLASTVLSAVAFAADGTKYPRVLAQDNTGTNQTGYSPYAAGGNVTITVTGGAVSGWVDVYFVIL